MEHVVKAAAQKLWAEVKKDLYFFGACGVAVGLFSTWQSRARRLGLSQDPTWSRDLLSDFLSFNAFGLVFFVYLLLGCICTVLEASGRPVRKLSQALDHAEDRLTQFASSIVSFMAGLLIFVVVASVINFDAGGLGVLLICTLFSAFLVCTYLASSLVARRAQPFDLWWVAVLALVAVALALGWLLLFASA